MGSEAHKVFLSRSLDLSADEEYGFAETVEDNLRGEPATAEKNDFEEKVKRPEKALEISPEVSFKK